MLNNEYDPSRKRTRDVSPDQGLFLHKDGLDLAYLKESDCLRNRPYGRHMSKTVQRYHTGG